MATTNHHSRNYMLALEPRFMYDAAELVEAVAGTDSGTQQETQPCGNNPNSETSTTNSLVDAASEYTPPPSTVTEQTATSTTELVFVDPRLKNYQELISGLDENLQVIMLDANGDGIEMITEELSNHDNIQAVHLLSHGDNGQVVLGKVQLDNNALDDPTYQNQIVKWGESLTEDADILLYGCKVAENEQGREFIHRISELTGADVAASDDTTGEDGDWELEQKTGSIEAETIDGGDYQGTLDTPTVSAEDV